MTVAVYVRVSTQRQVQAQSIEQQLDRLRAHLRDQGVELASEKVFRDDGYSGATLSRPGLDRLRDAARAGEVDRVLVTGPDRLARNYVQLMVLLEELERAGREVAFLDRPMGREPQDQLLLQIRGAVAEYERTLIAERVRRGRQAKLRAGCLLPWTRPLYGYRLDPGRPRDPAGVTLEAAEAAVVRELFAGSLEDHASLFGLAKRLRALGIASPNGRPGWSPATLRGLLTNPTYTGQVYAGRWRRRAPRLRRSATHPIGRPSDSSVPVPPAEWLPVASVPALVTEEEFARVQAKLARNRAFARRHNTRHAYLLRALVSCGVCRSSCVCRTVHPGYGYYVCGGKADPVHSGRDEPCPARYAPGTARRSRLAGPVRAAHRAGVDRPGAGARARRRLAAAGAAGPARAAAPGPARPRAAAGTPDRGLPARRRPAARVPAPPAGAGAAARGAGPAGRPAGGAGGPAGRARPLGGPRRPPLPAGFGGAPRAGGAASAAVLGRRVGAGLAGADFAGKRQLVELLVDRVLVADGEVEIRYAIPLSPASERVPFCHLRKDYLDDPHALVAERDVGDRERVVVGGQDELAVQLLGPADLGLIQVRPAVVILAQVGAEPLGGEQPTGGLGMIRMQARQLGPEELEDLRPVPPLLVRLLPVQAQDVAPTALAPAEHDLLGTQLGVDLGIAARMREDLVPDLLHPPDRRGQDIAPGPLGERVAVGLRVQPGVAHEQDAAEPHLPQVRLDRLHGGDVGRVAGKHPGPHRHALTRDGQGDHHLRVVVPPLLAVPAPAQRREGQPAPLVGGDVLLVGLEPGGGAVVEHQVDVELEQVDRAPEHRLLDRGPVLGQEVHGAVELVQADVARLGQPHPVEPALVAGELG